MKIIAYVLSFFVLSSCCTRNECPDVELPKVEVIVSGMASNSDPLVVQEFFGDSLISVEVYDHERIGSDNSFYVVPFKSYKDYQLGMMRKFHIVRDSTVDSLYNFRCDFSSKKVKCNTCIFYIKDREDIMEFRNFSFNMNTMHLEGVQTVNIVH